MAVFRIERTRDYTVMSNHHLRNANLSLKAKGLLSMMPCFSVYSERTVIYFCFRLFGLSGIVILSWPLASRGFKYFLVK